MSDSLYLSPKPPSHVYTVMTAALELDSDSVPLLRPQHSSAAPTSDPAPETLQSELRVLPSPDPDNFTPSPTSPLCLGENCTTQKLTSPLIIPSI